MRRNELVYALNAGGVDPEAIARVDLEKMRLAGEHPVANLLPRVLGPATIRPGTQNLLRIPSDNQTRTIRFQRAVGTSYILLLSASEMRVVLNGAIQQVPSVSTAINSGSWSDQSTSPATATGGSSLSFSATSTASARLRQAVTVASDDRTKENILRIVVSAGPLVFRVGTTAGGQELIADTTLDTGTHKIAITPGVGVGTIYVELRADDPVTRSVSSIQFESTLLGGTGDLVLPTPWDTYAKCKALRTWQSLDVMFAGDGYSQPRRIEHRGPLSWSVAQYKSVKGPYITGPSRISLTPTALSGNTTVTASESYFQSGHVGALLEVTQVGKTVTQVFNGAAQTSDYITVVGVSTGRDGYYTGVNTSSFTGTIVLERSFDVDTPTSWSTVFTYTNSGVAFVRTKYNDGLDNSTVHYRYRVTAYTSGTATMTMEYEAGVQVAQARITTYTSGTSVDVEVTKNFGNTNPSRDWRIGDWSDVKGWPRVPIIHDGRMHWFRDDKDYGSIVDDYTNYDDSKTGDAAPFTRSVGLGGQSGVLWAVSQARLLAGTETFEAVIAASELDEPLTPTRYTVRKPSRRGCADVAAVEHDEGAFYVQLSRRRLYEISIPDGGSKYRSQDMSRLNPAAYRAGIARLAVQQQPDTRVYAVLDDGSVSVLTYDRDDKIAAVTTISVAGGLVEDVCVLPETDQNDVYFLVNRSGARYLERMGKENDQRAVSTCTLLDGYRVLTGSISSISGGTHFASQTVQVWADGQKRADVTLDGSGNGSLGATYSRVVYGKRFTGVFGSVKLAYAAQLGTALGQTKIVHGAQVILANSCLDGVSIGPDASNLDPLPVLVDGAARTANQFFSHYDQDLMPINSTWGPDARIYVSVDSAQGPCTIQAIVLDIETREGVSAPARN